MGLPLAPEHVALPAIDAAGYTVWHYWAHSPRPALTFGPLLDQLGGDLCDKGSSRGEHAWHFLLMAALRPALDAWSFHRGIPDEPVRPGMDTFAHCAAWSGDSGILSVFGEEELGSVNARDEHGLSPLVIAIHRGDDRLVQAFLMAGADPMVADAQGRNALHHAAQYAEPGLFALLEDAGGDSSAPDFNGLTASDLLRARRQVSSKDLAHVREHWLKRRALRLPF